MAVVHATSAGTERYRQRFAGTIPEEHFRARDGCMLSSIGLGTYLGDPDDATDDAYQQAIVAAVRSGCNVLDTAINYRHQRSERAIARAIRCLQDEHAILREELFVSTKGGYVPFDGDYPDEFLERYPDLAGDVTRAGTSAESHRPSEGVREPQLRK